MNRLVPLAAAGLLIVLLLGVAWAEYRVWSECLDAHSFLYCLRTIQ